MNLHVPQSEEARAEAMTLMRVHDQIISPRYGGPIIGAIRDYLTAAFLLTRDETVLDEEEFADLALSGGYAGPLPTPLRSKPKRVYSGKQLFSLFLPRDLSFFMMSKWAQSLKTEKHNDVLIRNGKLETGVIDRAAIGSEEPDSILQRITKDYGTEEARRFLNSVLSVLRAFITRMGFTYGQDELYLDEKAEKLVKSGIADSYFKVENLFSQYHSGKLQLTKGLSAEEALEFYIVNELAKARDHAGRVADEALPLTNSGVVMARTGARGSSLNLGQMTAALGQQSVRGKRIAHGYKGRALSQFRLGDTSPDSKGFIKSNYREGLSPTEFFFHAMGGREGLVDTAVRTQQSGYMQRRLVNALEHLKVEYDLTVRDPHGHIIQFLYGEDGIDPAKSDHGNAVNTSRLIETESIEHKSKVRSRSSDLDSIISKYSDELNPMMQKVLKSQLTKTSLTDHGMKNVLAKTLELIKKSAIEPGEASGIVAAQSIGEPGTQMTLRTFHFAGVRERDVTLGLPRLIELVDARKIPATPTMNVFMDKEHRATEGKAMKVARSILFTKIADVITSSEVDFVGGVKLYVDNQKLKERDCKLEDVGDVAKVGKRKIEVDEDRNVVSIKLEGADIPTLFTLRNKVLNQRVHGIPGVSRVTMLKEEDEWVIQTSGSNLGKVLKTPGVDTSRTTTNNIWEIATVLGIEAARSALMNEVTATLDEQGLEVDIRHILLVADLMTSRGFLQSIGRHGIAGTKSSVLARAAFEITVPTLAEAAVTGEVEALKGVTENVIVGISVPVGTGIVDLFMKR